VCERVSSDCSEWGESEQKNKTPAEETTNRYFFREVVEHTPTRVKIVLIVLEPCESEQQNKIRKQLHTTTSRTDTPCAVSSDSSGTIENRTAE